MKRVLVLGCTGSIGTSTLDILRHMPDQFVTVGLTAHSNKQKLDELCSEFSCKGILTSQDSMTALQALIDTTKPDIVVNGIAGAAGLEPSRIVLQSGIDLALANKETIVMAAPLVQKLARENNCHIIPVDSEHSAIFNLVAQCGKQNIDQIVITASGGPFRTLPSEKLNKVTVQDALKHPTWNMGKKITIDSASLANKGLEVIEACRLFDVSADQIQVVVHPQSLIHSLVRTKDGVLYAQISDPDMKHPIVSALSWPHILPNYMERFDLFDHEMTFFKPRMQDFPMLQYAFDAAKLSGGYTIAYNAADEIAAHAFIDSKIHFMDIPRIVKSVLDKDWTTAPQSFEDVFAIDSKARLIAKDCL
ncbi:MAG: 1-deoxy-D-xylulose-5-phosphate reductoisomerase [Treponema sp.]|nr:1-deoxy-D-xylulose-5-phosphate reductoisomerase [Treponema sp.]